MTDRRARRGAGAAATAGPSYLVARLDLKLPVIGIYDAPDPEAFRPLVSPPVGAWACIFMFSERWRRGETLHLTAERCGCGGAGHYLFGKEFASRRERLAFFVDRHGMKAARDLLAGEDVAPYRPRHRNVLIGPLREGQEEHLVSVTFLVNPDQLAALVWGAHYHHAPAEGALVTAPFSSGCGLLAAMLGARHLPRGVIGGTDLAMRRFLPPSVLAFTVTKPLFEELCRLDDRSFLGKEWLEELRRSRPGGLGGTDDGRAP